MAASRQACLKPTDSVLALFNETVFSRGHIEGREVGKHVAFLCPADNVSSAGCGVEFKNWRVIAIAVNGGPISKMKTLLQVRNKKLLTTKDCFHSPQSRCDTQASEPA